MRPYYQGKVKCRPGDTFDAETGKKLARKKAIHRYNVASAKKWVAFLLDMMKLLNDTIIYLQKQQLIHIVEQNGQAIIVPYGVELNLPADSPILTPVDHPILTPVDSPTEENTEVTTEENGGDANG